MRQWAVWRPFWIMFTIYLLLLFGQRKQMLFGNCSKYKALYFTNNNAASCFLFTSYSVTKNSICHCSLEVKSFMFSQWKLTLCNSKFASCFLLCSYCMLSLNINYFVTVQGINTIKLYVFPTKIYIVQITRLLLVKHLYFSNCALKLVVLYPSQVRSFVFSQLMFIIPNKQGCSLLSYQMI